MYDKKNLLGKNIVEQSARAILIDSQDNLILFKRNKPGVPIYWATPGGHVEQTDKSIEAALKRELAEELNARVINISQVFIYSSISPTGLIVEHFFVARLARMDESAPRPGVEFQNPDAHGTYKIERINLHHASLESLNLQPGALKRFVIDNKDALIAIAKEPDSQL